MGRDAPTIVRFASPGRRARWLVLLALISIAAGCRTPCLSAAVDCFAQPDPSAAIAEAELERAWDEWATRHLRMGDIVFRMGVSRVVLNLFDVSKFSAELADSEYSHAGLVVFEEGRPWVYDICRGHDARRMPFSAFLMEYKLAFGVKRLKPEHRPHILGAVEYCRWVHARRVPFDGDFRPENGRLYCTEMIEGAYRSSGLALSEPVRIDQLPNYHEHPTLVRLLTTCSTLTSEQEVLIPGNDRLGIWASDKLEFVYAAPDPLSDPPRW
ncbi:MAG: YiiX/YebB-like N1pC/P60 family cysteine hydrolase [Planctomycetales bacterium]